MHETSRQDCWPDFVDLLLDTVFLVDAGGRTRAFINGHPAPVAQLRELGELLVDIHGQHAHQSLLRAQTQRALLDAYAGAQDLAAQVSEAHRAWAELRARHASAVNDARSLQSERETLAWKASELAQRLSALPNAGKVHTLFNTHWHPEQTGSNESLGQAGATIVAQENTKQWLTTDVTWSWNGRRFTRLPKVAQPNKTFYTSGTLDSDVRYGHIPDAAHTDGDMYVFFPTQNVLAVGDVVSNQGWPVVDWATGGWIGGMAGGLQRLQTLANDQTRIVPGRGPV